MELVSLEEIQRAVSLARRIYDQVDSPQVWGRTTASGSAELDFIQDELERLEKDYGKKESQEQHPKLNLG